MHSKKVMIGLVSALLFLSFTAVTSLNYYLSRNKVIDTIATKELPLTSDNIYSEVQRDLLIPKIVSSAMANDAFLIDWIESGEPDAAIISKYLKDLANKFGAFTSFLVVENSLNFYYPNGFVKKLHPEEPRDEWFFRVRKMDEKFEINIDPAEAHNDELTIFINVKVLNENQTFIGAIGLGLTIDLLKTRLSDYRERYGNEVYFITKEGQIILHSDDQYRQKQLNDFKHFSDISKDILKLDQGEFRYVGEKGEVILQTRYVEDIDLILAVEANVSDLTKDAYKNFLLNLLIGFLVASLVLWMLLKTIGKYQDQLENLALRDQLTGLLNRTGFIDNYENLRKGTNEGSSLIMLDIDNFKDVNDKLGHLKGDEILKIISKVLLKNSRDEDIVARWGGEEFLFLVHNADIELGTQIAERLRVAIQESTEVYELVNSGVTASLGVTDCDLSNDIFFNVEKADKNLYQAKAKGRNCVI